MRNSFTASVEFKEKSLLVKGGEAYGDYVTRVTAITDEPYDVHRGFANTSWDMSVFDKIRLSEPLCKEDWEDAKRFNQKYRNPQAIIPSTIQIGDSCSWRLPKPKSL